MAEPKQRSEVAVAFDAVLAALKEASERLHQLSEDFRLRTEKFRRLLRAVFLVLGLVLISVGVQLVIARSTNSLVRTVDGVLDPEGKYQADSKASTADVLLSLSVENDCRARRLHAGMPAPTPDKSCQTQTPGEVYPGR